VSRSTAAVYWLTPLTAQAGTRIVLAGRYPGARYASLEVTKPGGGLFTVNGVTSELSDFRIAPAPGSTNPWQPSARHPGRRAGGQFTVTIQAGVAPGQVNTLPLAPPGPATGTSYLVYRVYLPVGGDFSRVPLPTVTVTSGGVLEHLPGCPPPAAGAAAVAGPTAAAPGGSGEFARPPAGSGTGLSPSADTGYLAAAVTPPGHGDVVVMRGKAPTAHESEHHLPVVREDVPRDQDDGSAGRPAAGRPVRLRVYRCPAGQGWHLTSRRPRRRQGAARRPPRNGRLRNRAGRFRGGAS
jgi:hypothetical protein